MPAKVKALLKSQDFLTEVKTSEHSILIDEPESFGGTNQGMQPTELLAGSLASCTAITLKMYLNRKEFVATNVDVTVETNNWNQLSMSLKEQF